MKSNKIFLPLIFLTFTLSMAAPDFIVSSVSGPSSAKAGDIVQVTIQVQNGGSSITDATKYVRARVVLSQDQTISLNDLYYVDNNDFKATDLNGGVFIGKYVTFQIPSDASGTYYWGCYIDSPNYWVESNENNNTKCGNSITIQPLSNPPSAPILVVPSNGAVLQDNTPDLTWTLGSTGNVNYFDVQVSTSSSFSTITQEDAHWSTTNWTPTLNNGTYYWRVRAHDLNGAWSGWSNYWSLTVSAAPPTISVSPTSFNEQVEAGRYIVETVNIYNAGDAGLDISNFAAYCDNPPSPTWIGSFNPTSISVPAHSNGSFTFNINAINLQPGARTGRVVISSNASNSPSLTINVNLNVVAQAQPVISVYPQSFNTTIDSGTYIVVTDTIKNSGTADLTVNGFSVYHDNPSSPAWIGPFNPTSMSVPAGGKSTYTFNINAINLVTGQRTGRVVINSNDPITPQKTINVTINVTPRNDLVLLTPAQNEIVPGVSIPLSWSGITNADSFDLIVDDDRDLMTPEVSKKQLPVLIGYKQTDFNVGGWLADDYYYWKVIAYKNGIAYSSSLGSFIVKSTPQTPVWAPVLRAYNPGDKDHFYCTSQQKQSTAIPQGYRAEKPQGFISIFPFNDADMVPIFRLYNGSIYPGSVSNSARCHFYTIDKAEKDSCIAHNWLYEGIIGFAYRNYQPGLVKLYHLFLNKNNPITYDHFYTIDEFERANAISQYGFQDMGVLAYVSPTGNNSTLPYSLNGPSVGSGADPFNGNLSHWETSSFSIPEGRMSLDLSHQYSSLSVLLKTPVRCLGPGWSHTYSACLTNNDGCIKIFWPGGGYNVYNSANFARVSKGIYDSLSKISDTLYQVKTKDQIVYRFAMIHRADSIAVLSSISDRNNNSIQCIHDGNGNLTSVIGPKGRTLTFTYISSQGSTSLISDIADPSGRHISFAYDSAENLISYVNAKGDITHYAYDPQWPFEHLLDTITQPEGNKIVNVYDVNISSNATRRVVSQSYGNVGSPMQSITLDYSNSSFVRVSDSKNRYDFYYKPQKDGIIQSLLSPTGNASYQYDDSLRNPTCPTKITDGMGYITNASYDAMGNALQISKPYGIKHNFTYTPFNDLAQYIGPRNETTTYNYNANGNLTEVVNYRGSTTISYRADGLIDSIIDALGNRTKLSYNTYGNVISVQDPLNNSWQSTYDNVSRLINSQNPKGQISRTNYSNTDLVISSIGSINDTTGYVYDRNGRLTIIQNAKHYNTTLAYNSLNMLTSMTNPLGKTTQFGYKDARLTKKTFANGDTLGFAYDSSSRVVAVSGAANATFQYDSNDNVRKVIEGSNQMTLGYDSLNRLTSYVDYSGTTVGYAWDKTGNLQSIAYPGGGTVTYSYYLDNLLYQVSDWLGNTTTYNYRNDGSLDYCIYPNGVKSFYNYDKAGRVTSIANVKTNGDTICGYSFTLDALGNITGETKKEPYSDPQIPADNTSYTCNAGNQLTNAGSITFSYDNNGNMTGRTIGGVTTAYGFNPLNRLLTIDSAGVRNATYTYDIYGNRRSATRNGATVNYMLDIAGSMSNVLVEKDGSGNPQYFYIYGLGMVYRIKNGGTMECYHYDLRGSTIAMTNSSQAITHKYAYGSYGEMVVDSGINDNLFKFVGKYGVMDEGKGMHFMRARYYDSRIGRFLSEDPVWGMNLYGYGEGNPAIYNDPRGTTSVSISCSGGEGVFFKGSIIYASGIVYGSGGVGVGVGGGCAIGASSAIPQVGSSVSASCEVGYGPVSGEVSIDETGEIDGGVSYGLRKFKLGVKSECSATANGTVKLFSLKASSVELNEHLISPSGFRNTTIGLKEHFVQGGKNERFIQGGQKATPKTKPVVSGTHANSTASIILY